MEFGLNELQQEIRQTARDVLTRHAPFHVVRAAAETGEGHDASLWAEFVDLGWPGIAVPEEDGGVGLGFVELCLIGEEHGYAVAPTPLIGTTLVAAALVAGGESEHRQALQKICAGEVTGAIGEVEGDRSELVLDAAAGAVTVIVAEDFAYLADGVPTPRETIDPTRRYGQLARVDGVEVCESRPLSDRARVLLAAELVGISQRALDLTLAYVAEREQFGVPIGSFQAVAHSCASMLRHVEIARSAVYAAAWAADAAPETLPEAAALAKTAATDAGREVTGAAIQAHGGIGFTWEADLHWLFKRAQLDGQLFGGSAVQRRFLGEIIAEGTTRAS